MRKANAQPGRRSLVSGSVARLFARPIVAWTAAEKSAYRLREVLRRPARSVSEALGDATAKLAAWLMAMAAVVLLGTIGVSAIGLVSAAAASIVDAVAAPLIPYAGLMSATHGVRLGILWKTPDWSIDRRDGLLGAMQNPGDFDLLPAAVIVGLGYLIQAY